MTTSTSTRPASGPAPDGPNRMSPVKIAAWVAVALVGALCWTVLALSRGEEVSALWILFAALSSYLIAYRFYSRFIARRVLKLDDTRATPAERLENGTDFEVTDRRVLFGHHFAAIAGAGPLVGPVLAAQMGYLPGTIWIIVGVIVRGSRAGHGHHVLLHAARREEPGPDGPRGDRRRRRHRRPDRRVRDHDHHPGRALAGRGQRARRVALGRLLHRPDDPDRALHGLLPALPATRPGPGGHRDRRRAAAARDHRRRVRRGLGPRRVADPVEGDPDPRRWWSTASSPRSSRSGCC